MTKLVNFDLTGQVMIVTGASKGIGKAIALAAAEWGAPISDTAADFTTFRHQYDDRVQLEKAWRHGIAAAYVVGWQEEGSGLRPYIPDDHTSWIGRSDQFDHDGRAGIVIGVRGGYLSAENLAELAALETQNPDVQAEDIASRALREISSWCSRSYSSGPLVTGQTSRARRRVSMPG